MIRALLLLAAVTACAATQSYEFGYVTLNHRWITVGYDASIENPLVFAKLPTERGGDPVIVQVRNVGGGTFEIRLREEEIAVTPHPATELVNFLVVSAGRGTLHCGLEYEAGSFTIPGDCTTYLNNWHTQSFSSLGASGVFMSQLQTLTTANGLLLHTRQRSVGATSAQIAMEFTEAQERTEVASPETVAWINIKKTGLSCQFEGQQCHVEAFTESGINHNFKTITANSVPATKELQFAIGQMQTHNGGDSAWLRRKDVFAGNTFKVQVEEETTLNSETNHVNEDGGFLVSTCQPVQACECFIYPKSCAMQPSATQYTAGTCACILYSDANPNPTTQCQ